MKNKKNIVIAIVAAVLGAGLIVGAYFLYAHLTKENAPDNLVFFTSESSGSEGETVPAGETGKDLPQTSSAQTRETPTELPTDAQTDPATTGAPTEVPPSDGQTSPTPTPTPTPTTSIETPTPTPETPTPTPAPEPPLIDPDVPDFILQDMDGNKVKLSSFFGRPIVLNFWASWCPPCKEEMPNFEKSCKRHEDVVFLMVNLTKSDTVRDAKQLIADKGYTFPVYFDITGNGGELFEISSIPVTCFIDRTGHLVAKAVGSISASSLEKGIASITK